MISRIVPNFPEPHEREFFYNTIARAMEQISSLNDRDKHFVFFGNHQKPGFYIEPNLTDLCSRLGNILKPEQIVQNNSVYPFYNLFSAKKMQRRFKDLILNSLRSHRSRFRLTVPVEQDLKTPRYCPTCLAQYKKEGKPLYPRVEWQLPGINICPFDHTYLKEYPLLEREDISQQYIVMQEDRLSFKGSLCEDPNMINISEMALELFDYPIFAFCHEELQQKLNVILREEDYFNGINLDYKKFYQDIEEYYKMHHFKNFPEELFFFNDRTSFKSTWLGRVLFPSKATPNPFHWLIVLNFLGFSLKDFLNTDVNKENFFFPLENQKEICINPACPSVGKNSSFNISTAFNDSSSNGIKRIYRCSDCHMVFSTINDEFDAIIQSGEKFACFIEEIYTQDISISEIADVFNLTEEQMLKLTEKIEVLSFDKKVKEYRQRVYDWVSDICQNINSFKKQSFLANLKEQYPKEYQFLLTYDQKRFNKILDAIMRLDQNGYSLERIYSLEKATFQYIE